MGIAERRTQIMRVLCRRRSETIQNLAAEFGVSERTIRRDIEALSLHEPIFTQPGRFGGGVYVVDSYYIDRMYFQEQEITVMNKLLVSAEKKTACELSERELHTLRRLIIDHSKPKRNEERK